MARITYVPARIQLARAYERMGQEEKARREFEAIERLLREALDQAKASPDQEILRFAARAGLAEVLVAQKKHREAEPYLLAVHEAITRRPGPDGAKDADEVVERLIQVYEATGQSEKKAEWQAKRKSLPSGK
jgi:hypothetical protein